MKGTNSVHRFLRLLLTGGLVSALISGCSNSKPEIRVTYRGIAPSGYIDQTFTFTNSESKAQLVKISAEPLDVDGKLLSSVEVRSAYGSLKQGIVVPQGEWTDILQFGGTDRSRVTGVRTKIVSSSAAPLYDNVKVEPTVEVRSGGQAAVKSDPFDEVSVNNPNSVPIAVEVICFVWGRPEPGGSQQAKEVALVATLTSVPSKGSASALVTAEFATRTASEGFGCSSLKAVLRP